MAEIIEIVNSLTGLPERVIRYSHSAQQIDDAVDVLGSANNPQSALAALGAGVRPNLLINPAFEVNQRGQDSYTGAVYGYDGWKGTRSTTVVRKSGNIVTVSDASTREGGCSQRVEKRFDGKTLTASVLVTSVSDSVKLWIRNDSDFTSYATATTKTPGLLSVTAEIPDGYPSNLIFYLDGTGGSVTGNTTFAFAAPCKLEEGDTQTIAYQTAGGTLELLQQPDMDYGTQLAKCQRYLFIVRPYWKVIGVGYKASTTKAIVPFTCPAPLRAEPSAAIDDLSKVTLRRATGANITPTSISAVRIGGNYNVVSLELVIPENTDPLYTAYFLYFDGTGGAATLTLSAEP